MELAVKKIILDEHSHYCCVLCNRDFGRLSFTGIWLTGRSDLNEHVIACHPNVDNTIETNPDSGIVKCKKCKAELSDVYSVITHKRLCGKYCINEGYTKCDIVYRIYKTTCFKCGHVIKQPYYCIGIHTDQTRLTYEMSKHLFKHECDGKMKTRLEMFHLLVHNIGIDEFSAQDIVQRAYPMGKFKVDW